MMRSGLNFSERKSVQNSIADDERRIWDGTSEREINKALTTFLNGTGPADYQLPSLTGTKNVLSGKLNAPKFSLGAMVKKSWHPNMAVDFQGRSSPPANNYSPNSDRE